MSRKAEVERLKAQFLGLIDAGVVTTDGLLRELGCSKPSFYNIAKQLEREGHGDRLRPWQEANLRFMVDRLRELIARGVTVRDSQARELGCGKSLIVRYRNALRAEGGLVTDTRKLTITERRREEYERDPAVRAETARRIREERDKLVSQRMPPSPPPRVRRMPPRTPKEHCDILRAMWRKRLRDRSNPNPVIQVSA